MSEERIQVKLRIAEGEERIAEQRYEIARKLAAGGDAASETLLLSAMESSQAFRLRRLGTLT